MKRLPPAELPHWPRLMQRPLAAAYLGVSPTTFDRYFGHIPPVPLDNGNRMWDRHDLDADIECRKGHIDSAAPAGHRAKGRADEWDDICEADLQIRAGSPAR